MSAPSDLRTLVMHGLRLKGFAEAAGVGEAVGVPEADAKPMLDQLVADGLATYRDGKLSGFSLTKPGREEHARLLSAELDGGGRARRHRRRPTGSSCSSTPSCCPVCTEWQLRDVDGESTVNDHSDAAYDAAVIEKLAALHARVEPICADLGAALDRFARLRPAPRRCPRSGCRRATATGSRSR